MVVGKSLSRASSFEDCFFNNKIQGSYSQLIFAYTASFAPRQTLVAGGHHQENRA